MRTTLKEHGGAVRYWKRKGERAVLCGDGKILTMNDSNGKWRQSIEHSPDMMAALGWTPDTRPSMSAAVTRTTREARRKATEP